MELIHKPSQSIEDIEKLLTSCGVSWERKELEVGFNRDIFFTIYGIRYKIVWYVHQLYLYILNTHIDMRYAQFPFMLLEIDGNAPIAPKANNSLKFSSFTKDGKTIYESFQIPLEVTK